MTLKIKVLGPGCPKCKTLEKITLEVIAENNFDAEVSKIDDIIQIMNYGVMSTPALVINDKAVIKGYLPSKEEIIKEIKKASNG